MFIRKRSYSNLKIQSTRCVFCIFFCIVGFMNCLHAFILYQFRPFCKDCVGDVRADVGMNGLAALPETGPSTANAVDYEWTAKQRK